MKKISILLLALFLATMCEASKFNRIIYPIKTEDASKYILEQSKVPERIISASPAVTEILFTFNLQDKIVGVTKNCDYPEAVKQIRKIGDKKIDVNKSVKLKPDLVILALSDYSTDELASMRKNRFMTTVTFETWLGEISTEVREVSLEVFAVDPKSMTDVLNMIDTIGTITNREHAAYSLNQRLKRRIEWVAARAKNEKRLKGYMLTSKRPLMVAGEGTYLSDILEIAGINNLAPKNKGMFIKLNRKDIEKAGLDIIITSTSVARNEKDVYNDRSFRKTNVGKNKKAVCIDKELLMRPGPRITEALTQIAEKTYGWSKDEKTEE